MTKEEFLNIKLGDRIIDTGTDRTGTVEVRSTGEVYVCFDDDRDSLVSYDLSDDPECFLNLKRI